MSTVSLPAFPSITGFDGKQVKGSVGMDLVDYFAAAAAQALIVTGVEWTSHKAEQAYNIAEALAAVRERRRQERISESQVGPDAAREASL